MPSSPSMQSFGQASALPLKKQEMHEYHQTTYYDGSHVQIAESRRHPWAVRKVEPSVQAYTDFVLYPEENRHLNPRSGFEEVSSQAHPTLRMRAAEPSPIHVTLAKHSSKVRSKPVSLHSSAKSSQSLPLEAKATLHTSTDPTPPPTPRIDRLSTPDLSDLDEAPFCDCGVALHVAKRCTECNMEVDLWST